MNLPGLTITSDYNTYALPDEISMQLTHHDVKLYYFQYVQHRIKPIKSGDILLVDDESCLDKNNEPILKFSAKKLEEMAKLKAEGYLPKKAVVSFLVYWFDQENDKESLIVLPEIFFESNSN